MRRFEIGLGALVVTTCCVVVGACGDDGGTTDTGASSSTTSDTSQGGNTSQGGAGGASQGGAGGTSQGGAGGANQGGGGGSAALAFCAKSCAGAADCCGGSPLCPGNSYPNNPTCEGGLCKAAQCSANADCTLGGLMPDDECITIDAGGSDFKTCGKPCAANSDCTLLGLECVGKAKDGSSYCSAAVQGCQSNADCGKGYGDSCDVGSGACTCSANAECTGTGVDTCVVP